MRFVSQEITQEEEVEVKSVEDTSAIIDNVSDPSQTSEASSLDVPSGLESGYKGFAWGTSAGSKISNNFSPLQLLTTTILYN